MNGRDAKLLRDLGDHRRDAFEAVVRENYRAVYGRMWHLTGGDADAAADLTQEAFVEAWRSLATFAGRSSLKTWLHTVAVRVWARKRHRYTAVTPLGDALDAVLSLAADPAPGPAALAEAADARRALEEALRSLPAAHREAVRLFFFEQFAYAEIAEAQGVPVGTVKSRLHGALRRLRGLVPPSLKEML
jgi:RNA polymerase sigma-70 factor (ECF subfamily)